MTEFTNVPGVTIHKEDEGDYNPKKKKSDSLLKWSRDRRGYVI
jgi:hypothetical protein